MKDKTNVYPVYIELIVEYRTIDDIETAVTEVLKMVPDTLKGSITKVYCSGMSNRD